MIGVIADIHGNASALAAVLAEAGSAGVTELAFCGDLVGYYYEPKRCLEMLSEWKTTWIRGNHDEMLARALQAPEVATEARARYGSGLLAALETLTPPQLDWLANLPDSVRFTVNGKEILMAHGSPWDPSQYLYPDAPDSVFARCAESGADFVLLGHTHYQLAKRAGTTLVLNPGSVGQARGKRRGSAHWALLDVSRGAYEHRSTPYETASLVSEVRRRDPDVPYLESVLTPAAVS